MLLSARCVVSQPTIVEASNNRHIPASVLNNRMVVSLTWFTMRHKVCIQNLNLIAGNIVQEIKIPG